MESTQLKNLLAHRLIYLGIVLFLLGLIVGLVIPALANPRMALASHIEGVFNGMFLVLLGLIWHRVDLSDRWMKINFWLAIFGTFMNWFAMLVAAIFDAGKMLNVAAKGKEGHPAVEAFITFALISLSVAMIWISISVLVGLRRHWRVQQG
jgi:hydroxylaminobenzene mutase